MTKAFIDNYSEHFLFSVHRRFRQVLVHARALLFRGLLYYSSIICLDLPGPYLDRAEVPESDEADECP